MNSSELGKIVKEMSVVQLKIEEMHNKIKGARIMRDACIAEMPAAKLHLFEVFNLAIAPLETEFDAACKLHTELFNTSGKDK
jgi:hypothetical protein